MEIGTRGRPRRATLARKSVASAGIGTARTASSIRLRQAENLLGNEAERQLWTHWCYAWDHDLAQIAFHVEFLCIAESAVCHDRLFAGTKPCFTGEIFGGVRRGPARQPPVVLPCCGHHHQPCRFELDPVTCQGVLDRLFHSNRTIEYDTCLRVIGCPRKGKLG